MSDSGAKQGLYSATQIARALGEKRQAMQRLLSGVVPSGQVMVSGNLANAWRITALPMQLQARLETEAQRHGCRNAEHLLSAPVQRWEPPIPVSKMAQEHLDKAIKLREALAPSLARVQDLSLSEAELCSAGNADYNRVFGYSISSRHFRRILDRTIMRDGGAQDWTRLDIYLEESAFSNSAPRVEAARQQYQHRELDETVLHLENKADPTAEDRAYLFDAAFHHYERLTAELGESAEAERQRKLIKGSLVLYLFSAVPVLSKSESSLRRVFELKLPVWREGGRTPQALMDKRTLNSGNFRTPDFAEDLKKIRDLAIRLGGNESLAHRQLRKQGELSQAFCEYYDFDMRRNKSYVPNSIREKLTPQVDMCGPIYRGPWEAKMRGPYIPRDWSDVKPGDYFSGDDVTWNSYFYFYDESGQLHIERGECLVLTDLRTGYPLDFLLIAGKYNSRHIRSLILSVHDRLGLPHVGTYFENGVWRARLISGEASKQSLHWRETFAGLAKSGCSLGSTQELGLAEPGLDLTTRNATTPRAKTIEGIFHILQDMQRRERGFVGPNERLAGQERMLDFIARCRRGKEHPGSELDSMEEWADRIRASLQEFAHEPQNGKMLPGLSPFEMWAPSVHQRPLRKLADEDRYILATHKKVVKVRQEGIVLTINGQRKLYCNEHTGKALSEGRDLLGFYNIDHPEILVCSDLDRKNYFSVKEIKLPAMSATSEQFAQVHAQIKGHTQPARTIYGGIEHKYRSFITRDTVTSESSKELGAFHNQEVEKAKAEKSATTRKLRKIQEKAAAEGIPVSPNVRNPDRVLTGIERATEYRKRIAQKEKSSRKTYQLDPDFACTPKPAAEPNTTTNAQTTNE